MYLLDVSLNTLDIKDLMSNHEYSCKDISLFLINTALFHLRVYDKLKRQQNLA